MSQCRAGKRWVALALLSNRVIILKFKLPKALNIGVLALVATALSSLSACNFAKLEKFATENEKQADYTDYSTSSSASSVSGLQSNLLVPDQIIRGGKTDFKGVLGQFARLLVGSGQDIKFSKPVAVSGRGDYLFVVDATQRTVFKYNLKTRTIQPIGDLGGQFVGDPGNIYVAKDMSFYVVDSVGKQVFHFSATGEVVGRFSDPANLSRPLDVLVNESNGHVLVADGSYSHIIVFNKFGDTLRAIGRRGNQNSRTPGTFRAITDMVMGKDGLYVLDRLVLPIQVLSLTKGFLYSFGESEQIFPTAIAVSKDEIIFVSDKADNIIRIYKQGDLLGKVGGGGSGPGRFRIITGLWAHDGYLYVADSLNRRVQVLRIVEDAFLNATPGL